MIKYLRIGVSALLLAFLAWRTDWAQVGQAFANLRLGLWLAAVLVLVATQVVSARRWQLMAAPLGFGRPLSQMTGFYFIGMYFNLLLPTSVGGDVVRAWYLDGRSGRRLRSFFTVFLDRLSGLLVLLALACVAVALSPLQLPSWIPWCVWGTAGGVVAGMLALPLAARANARLAVKAGQVRAALETLRTPRLLATTTLLSLVVQAANVVIVWLVGLAIGAEVPPTYYWVLVPMVSLLTLLPVSLNGMGIREGGTVVFLAPLGVGEGTALTLAFLWFAVTATTSLLGGVVYLFGRFPRPGAGELAGEEQSDHGPLGGDSDQGRTGEYPAAA